ncbi:MAG: hypothetical protein K9J17_02405 [Flavobacteriales bacterium]|nr:hypothetical protein [Flavobacteriales bacterium]
MLKNPIAATLIALLLATVVNSYYFTTGTDLTVVVSRTLFADLLLVLSLVPVYQTILLSNGVVGQLITDKVKSGMKPVAMYTFLLALITFVLFKLFGDPLVGARIVELTERMNSAIEQGLMTADQKTEQLELVKQIYSPSSHVIIVLISNLFVGFISSILAAILVKK